MSRCWSLALVLAAACGDPGANGRDVDLDFRAAPGSGSGGQGASGGGPLLGGSGGTGGTLSGPPVVTQLTPSSGDYGTTVTITGSRLGSASRAGTRLVIDAERQHAITPDGPEVLSWSEESIQFRFPFPYSGQVVVETLDGSAPAGGFTPSYVAGPAVAVSAGSAVVASLSPAPDQLLLAYSTLPIRIVSFAAGTISESSAAADGIDPASFRFYRQSDGATRAFAVSSETAPRIVSYVPGETLWTPEPTELSLSTDYRVAGGLDGAAVWFRQADGWYRARPSAAGWSVDKGPIADPGRAGLVSYAADSAGGLNVAYGVDTGTFIDDIETPFLQRVAPEATAFGDERPAGQAADDYLTALTLFDRGPGVVAYYCGSDVDPFGFTEDGFACWLSGNTSTAFLRRELNRTRPTFGFTESAIAVGYCDGDVLRLQTAAAGPGDVVAWPCAGADAVEFDTAGSAQIVVRSGAELYHPLPRPAP